MTKRTRTHSNRHSVRDTQHALAVAVRDKLATLGEFSHLLVYKQDDHIFVAHRGPPDAQEDVEPVLRISGIGNWRFGLSLRRASGRWEPVPIAGAMFEVIDEAVRTFAPWLAPRGIIRDTCETDY